MIREDIPQIASVLKNADLRLILISVLLYLGTTLLLSWRMQMIFVAAGAPIRWIESCNLTFIGFFFNNFLPTSVGGDIVKAMSAQRITGQSVKAVTCVLMDRIFGLFTFILIPSVSLIFFLKGVGNPVVPVIVYSFLVVSIFCFFLLFNRDLARRFGIVETILNKFKLGEKARKLYDGLHAFRHHKLLIAQAMLLSVVSQMAGIFVLYLMAVALGAQCSVIYFFMLVPVVSLLSMLPSLNGLGIRESGYIYFLKPYIGKEYAVAIGILGLGLLLLTSVIGGLIYLFRHEYHVQFKKAASSS